MILRWFLSKTVRHAVAMHRHVRRLLNAQRDILTPQAIEGVSAAITEMKQVVRSNAGKEPLQKEMEKLEKAANKWLKSSPNAAWRENVEVMLVALAVAMGIRTFFVQPFKIPTGSMQPTLFGVTSNPDFKSTFQFSDDLHPTPDFEIPNRVARFFQFWMNGVSYKHVVARADGSLLDGEKPVRFAIFTIWQRFRIGNEWYKVWFPPDDLLERTGLVKQRSTNPKVFKAGEDIMKIKIISGDHLFVDRLTYNFRSPKRGEIIVFQTAHIPEERRNDPAGRWSIPGDQFYIKRLVALGGERVQIGDDRHLVINGKPLDASTPHFENVYGFDPDQPAQDSQFSGHVNLTRLAPFFAGQPEGVVVRDGHYMVMGDNTLNSLDSRSWGDFPKESVIGKSFFVYWPITERFGWGNR